jgi:hypothetical protein
MSGQASSSPTSTPTEPSRLGGFGLVVLNAIAEDWGVQAGPPTVVWFEIPLRERG